MHTGSAVSPPDDVVGAKQFYIHKHQTDHNRVVSGERTFELVNFDWRYPYHIVHLNVQSGALMIPTHTYHRSVSGDTGSIVNNQAVRDDDFDAKETSAEKYQRALDLFTESVMKPDPDLRGCAYLSLIHI